MLLLVQLIPAMVVYVGVPSNDAGADYLARRYIAGSPDPVVESGVVQRIKRQFPLGIG